MRGRLNPRNAHRQSNGGRLSTPHESRFKVTGKRQIMGTRVIWLENQVRHPLEEIEVNGERQTDPLNQK
jgi:hypothetical protein